MPAAFAAAASMQHLDADLPSALSRGAYGGPVDRSLTFLVMSHDDANGRISLDADDRVRIDWRDVGDQPNVKRAADALRIASTALGGRYVANPTWSADQDHPLVTVHPLGGCPMAETRRRRASSTTGAGCSPGRPAPRCTTVST